MPPSSPQNSEPLLDQAVTLLRSSGLMFDEGVAQLKRRWIEQELDECHDNHARAAAALGMHRNTLYRQMRDLKILRLYRIGRRKSLPRQRDEKDLAYEQQA